MLKSIEKAGLEIQLTSLTEVLILIVFVLLLSISDEQAVLNKQDATIAELRDQINERDTEIAALKRKNRELKEELEGALTTVNLLKKFYDPFRDPEDISDQELIQSFKDLIELKNGIPGGGVDGIIKGKNNKIAELEAKVAELEARLSASTRDNKELRASIGKGGGDDKPICWIDGLVNEYRQIATIELTPEGYKVLGEWEPITEDPYISNVPGLMDFKTGFLSANEFQKSSSNVLRWTRSQDPECRFRVNIKNNVDSFATASEYKKSLGRVLRYFYQRPLD